MPFGFTARNFAMFCSFFQINSPRKLRSLLIAYESSRRYLAPMLTKAGVDMLPTLRRITAKDRHAHVIFLGRDGFSVGHVIAALDPLLYGMHGTMVHLPRAAADAAVHQADLWFHDDLRKAESFRKDGTHRHPDAERNGWSALLGLLEQHNVYIDGDRREYVLIDSGYRGSIQEMMAAAYPTVRFYGCYLFFSASPDDPHPGSKKGFVAHFDATSGLGGLGIRDRVIDDQELTFAHHDAVAAVEELLRGTSLDTLITADGPQGDCRHLEPLEGLNPLLVAHEYHEPLFREATLAIMLRATNQYAAEVRDRQASEPDTWYAALSDDATRLRPQLHAWLTRRPMDRALKRLLDSFVRRADKNLVGQLASLTRSKSISHKSHFALWSEFDRCNGLDAKVEFVRNAANVRPLADQC